MQSFISTQKEEIQELKRNIGRCERMACRRSVTFTEGRDEPKIDCVIVKMVNHLSVLMLTLMLENYWRKHCWPLEGCIEYPSRNWRIPQSKSNTRQIVVWLPNICWNERIHTRILPSRYRLPKPCDFRWCNRGVLCKTRLSYKIRTDCGVKLFSSDSAKAICDFSRLLIQLVRSSFRLLSWWRSLMKSSEYSRGLLKTRIAASRWSSSAWIFGLPTRSRSARHSFIIHWWVDLPRSSWTSVNVPHLALAKLKMSSNRVIILMCRRNKSFTLSELRDTSPAIKLLQNFIFDGSEN